MSIEKEVVTTESGKQITIDPSLLIESVDYINKIVGAHRIILETVRDMIRMYMDNGLSPNEAAAVALEFQRRAGKKANELVGHEESEAATDDKDESDCSDATDDKEED